MVRYVEEHYDAGGAAILLKLNKRTLLNMVRAGDFPRASKPFPNKILIPAGDIQAWLDRHRIIRPAPGDGEEESNG